MYDTKKRNIKIQGDTRWKYTMLLFICEELLIKDDCIQINDQNRQKNGANDYNLSR
jgi:hypothetical protein